MNIRTKLAGLVALAAITPAFAQIKLNDNVSITGWAVGSYQYEDLRTGAGTASLDSSNLDAVLLGATITPTKDVTAVFSTYYRPNSGNVLSGDTGVTATGSEMTILDAYVSWAPNGNVTITGGKFLSYLGFESYYLADDNQISLANQQFLAPIPGYHDGVKVDYTVDKATTIGAAFVDSLYSPNTNVDGFAAGSTEGSGSLRQTAGAEAYYQYTGIDGLTIWAGYGYDQKAAAVEPTTLNPVNYLEPHSVQVYDLWATYTIGKNDSVSAEEIYKDGGGKYGSSSGEGSNWLVEESHSFTPKLALLARISGEDVTAGYWVPKNGQVFTSTTSYSYSSSSAEPTPVYSPVLSGLTGDDIRAVKYTLSPSYAVTANLTVRAEYSYSHYSNYDLVNYSQVGVTTNLIASVTKVTDDSFFGVQAVLKF